MPQGQADTAVSTDAKSAIPAGDRRLIEQWLPIAALGIESLRERTPMTPFPAPNRLHVWWARRPLVASRAAVLASLLPADADQTRFMHMLGIHGDPVEAKVRIAKATADGIRLGKDAYGYGRAFKYAPSHEELKWMRATLDNARPVVLDPTAGGGSIPFESLRLGCNTVANDLNPVASFILRATVEFPANFGQQLIERYQTLGEEFAKRCRERISAFFPSEPTEGTICDGYLWARTIVCPYSGGIIPLSPNLRLKGSDTGVRLIPLDADHPAYAPAEAKRLGAAAGKPYMHFEVVHNASEQSEGTVKGGAARCPYPGDSLNRTIDGDYIKAEAKAGRMGEQIFAVVYTERKIVGHTKTGKPKYKKLRGFRSPVPTDDVSEEVRAALSDKMPAWDARGIVPDEPYPDNTNDDRPRQYGMPLWRDMFSPRQLLGHGTSVEVFHELVEECGGPGKLSELDKAALTYVAIAIDKMLDWNSLSCTWELSKQRMGHTFARHDFAFRWSFAEMSPTIPGLGFDWVVKAVGKALQELIDLTGHGESGLWSKSEATPVTVTCDSGDQLAHVGDGSVDAVVFDPPYYDNVMYAELSDFFYVWLKRTAGLLFPEAFGAHLTDKDREAVANPAKFKAFKQVKGSGSVKKRAARDYQERMAAIFSEARRVLKPGGIMTLMFTHKASGAWDALAKGLVDAGFVITASWPIQTEAEGSMHIKNKNAAKSTIMLVCRPRPEVDADAEPTWWEDIEPQVESKVRQRVAEFQDGGIGGVDLYLACFGPALEVFSKHWPMKRGRPNQKPAPAKGAQLKLAEDDDFDPYAVRPEDALMAARRAVKDWRFSQLATLERKAHLDPVCEWFVLAWDAFKAAQFPADEALKLARVVGINFDEELRNMVLEVKGGDVILWDSATRAKKGTLGPARADHALDALHQVAFAGRERNLEAAKRIVEGAELANTPEWLTALNCALEVLPMPGQIAKAAGPVGGAAKDAEALEQVRKLLHGKTVPMAAPWKLFETTPE